MHTDLRLRLIAASLALAETPEARAAGERFLAEAETVGRRAAEPATWAAPILEPGVAAALEGMADGFALVADHAEFLAVRAGEVIGRPPR
jgi:hypothetical protein